MLGDDFGGGVLDEGSDGELARVMFCLADTLGQFLVLRLGLNDGQLDIAMTNT